MQLVIERERVIKDLQAEFSGAYPFLKIEFFRNGTVREKMHYPQKQVDIDKRLGEFSTFKKYEGKLDIRDDMTVADIENAFMDLFGLTIEVFRRSGNIWLETTMTDSWTLKQQNDHGQEITMGKKPGPNYGSDDYELNRDADH